MRMKVNELKSILNELPGEAEIIILDAYADWDEYTSIADYCCNDGRATMDVSKLSKEFKQFCREHDQLLCFGIEKVIFNDPATIVLWKDGTKTVVKAEDEEFDEEKGLAMAISKKALGNKGNYYEVFKKWISDENDFDNMDEMEKLLHINDVLSKSFNAVCDKAREISEHKQIGVYSKGQDKDQFYDLFGDKRPDICKTLNDLFGNKDE